MTTPVDNRCRADRTKYASDRPAEVRWAAQGRGDTRIPVLVDRRHQRRGTRNGHEV